MSHAKPTKSPTSFTEREIAALIDAVKVKLNVLFPGAYVNTEEVFDSDKKEAWEQIAILVNSVEGSKFSAEEVEMMYIKVMRSI